MTVMVLLLISLIGALVAAWPWRSRAAQVGGGALRVLLICALAFLLYSDAGAGIGRAWRRALVSADPETSASPAFPTLTPYQSGVTTMRREATKDIQSIIPFLGALVVLGVTPALRLWLPKTNARSPEAGAA